MKYFTTVGEREAEFRFRKQGAQLVVESLQGDRTVDLSMTGDGRAFSMIVEGRSYDCVLERDGDHSVVVIDGVAVRVLVQDERQRAAAAIAAAKPQGPSTVDAVMPGIVVEVMVSEGDAVEEGQTLVILEAMKMQNPIQASGPGRVLRIAVQQGEAVAGGQLLVEIGADEGP